MKKQSWLTKISGTLVFAFLYIPILSLIIYSFNASRLVTVWSGFSFKWYGSFIRNQAILDAAWASLKVAVVSSTLASILGLMAAFILVRFSRFRGRTLFTGMVTAPLVMPEVITGISLLLLFISLESFIGWPNGRSLMTIIIAHTTFSMAYVAVIVEARLSDFDYALEEAAMDLGAKQPKIFFNITLPIIAPAVISGWFLSFALSIDDLVIASFVSGPSSTTLPMLIFSKVRLGVSPEINALATVMILTVAITVTLGAWFMQRSARYKNTHL